MAVPGGGASAWSEDARGSVGVTLALGLEAGVAFCSWVRLSGSTEIKSSV